MNFPSPPPIETQPTLQAELFLPSTRCPWLRRCREPQRCPSSQDHSQQEAPPSPERVPALPLLGLLSSNSHAHLSALPGGWVLGGRKPSLVVSVASTIPCPPGVRPGAVTLPPLGALVGESSRCLQKPRFPFSSRRAQAGQMALCRKRSLKCTVCRSFKRQRPAVRRVSERSERVMNGLGLLP